MVEEAHVTEPIPLVDQFPQNTVKTNPLRYWKRIKIYLMNGTMKISVPEVL